MGAGAAVLAAADNPKVHAVGALYPASTSPSAESAARNVTAPGLVIGSGQNTMIDAGNPARVAHNWAGDIAYRELENGNQQGFSEDLLFKVFLGLGRPQFAAQETARGLLTGFLLHQLAGERKYSGFSEPDATAKKVTSYWDEDLAERADLLAVQR